MIFSVNIHLALLLVATAVSSVHSHGDHHQHHHHNDNDNDRRQLQADPEGGGGFGPDGRYENFADWTDSEEFKESGARCGTVDPTVQEMKESERVYEAWLNANLCDSTSCEFIDNVAKSTATIRVVWHIIRSSDGSGGVTTQQITDSMAVINAAFASAGYAFELTDTTTTDNTAYYVAGPDSRGEFDMKTALRTGDCSTLNVYSSNLGGGLLGRAAYPVDCAGNTVIDGVIIQESTVPGGSTPKYNEGDTLTHEVGHWLGLFHTFEGGCSEPGDLVADTPAEARPDYVCEQMRNSCHVGDNGGEPFDLVNNFMNYGPDACVDSYTDGQILRMASQFAAYRGPAPPTTPPEPSQSPSPAPTPACPAGANLFALSLLTDENGEETTYEIKNVCDGTIVKTGGPYADSTQFTEYECLDSSNAYEFTISDADGTGICCRSGVGSYTIFLDGVAKKTSGGEFGKMESTDFDGSTYTECTCPDGTNLFTLSLLTDEFGSETTYDIKNVCDDTTVKTAGPYVGFTQFTENACLDSSNTYKFTISDTNGDGICCLEGEGSYTIFLDGVAKKTGGVFGVMESTDFDGSTYTACPTTDDNPSEAPTSTPQPSGMPSDILTTSQAPSASPSGAPSRRPADMPNIAPPSAMPSASLGSGPISSPTGSPSGPNVGPSAVPSVGPSALPSSDAPNVGPSSTPSAMPSASLDSGPISGPTGSPTGPSTDPRPNVGPSAVPSVGPSALPSSDAPNVGPSSTPSAMPSASLGSGPISGPTGSPTGPSTDPSAVPSVDPNASISSGPSAGPSVGPSGSPSGSPSVGPISPSPSSAPPTMSPTQAGTVTVILDITITFATGTNLFETPFTRGPFDAVRLEALEMINEKLRSIFTNYVAVELDSGVWELGTLKFDLEETIVSTYSTTRATPSVSAVLSALNSIQYSKLLSIADDFGDLDSRYSSVSGIAGAARPTST